MEDYPLTLMSDRFSVHLSNGSVLNTNYAFWRHLKNSNKIETYKKLGIVMIYGYEIDRLMTEGFQHRNQNAVIHEKNK